MNSSNSIKVVLAFAVGVLLALGGSLIYVKLSDRSPSRPVVQQASAVPQPPPIATPSQQPEPATLPDANLGNPPEPVEAPTSKHSRTGLNSIGHRFSHNGVSPPEPQATPEAAPQPQTEIAQNEPPPQNPYAAPPPPANMPPQRPAVQEPSSTPEAAPEPAREPKTVTLDSGTSIVIRLTQAISSDHSSAGDSFRGTLQLPIVRDGFVIADKGSPVIGHVVTAQEAGKVKGRASLSLALSEINTTDGQRVSIQTSSYDKESSSATKGDAMKVGAGAALGAIIGAIAGGGKGAGIGAGVGTAAGAGDVLLSKRKAVMLPSETELTFRLSEPVTITERLN